MPHAVKLGLGPQDLIVLAKPPCSPLDIAPEPPSWVKQLDHYTPQYHHAQSTATSSQTIPTTAVRRRITGKQKPTNESSQTTWSFHQVQHQAVLLRFPNAGLVETTCSLSATAACSGALPSHNYSWDPWGFSNQISSNPMETYGAHAILTIKSHQTQWNHIGIHEILAIKCHQIQWNLMGSRWF